MECSKQDGLAQLRPVSPSGVQPPCIHDAYVITHVETSRCPQGSSSGVTSPKLVKWAAASKAAC
eukprot:scaffold125552_cov44-Prasinocladus_malaysianus.AAC.1